MALVKRDDAVGQIPASLTGEPFGVELTNGLGLAIPHKTTRSETFKRTQCRWHIEPDSRYAVRIGQIVVEQFRAQSRLDSLQGVESFVEILTNEVAEKWMHTVLNIERHMPNYIVSLLENWDPFRKQILEH